MMKTNKRFMLFLIILIFSVLIIITYKKNNKKLDSEEIKTVAGIQAIPVTSYVVERSYWDYWKTYYGKIRSVSEQSITAYVREFVSAVYVDVGDKVSVGQVLCELEKITQTTELASQLTDFQNAKRDLERKKRLYDAGGISKKEVEQALALLNERRARLQEAQTTMHRTAIRSSMEGVVISKDIDVGEVAEPGIELFRLADLNKLEVEVMLASSDAVTLDVGSPCRILCRNTITRGFVKRIDPEAQSETGMYKTVISLERPVNLYPGTFVEIQIRLDSRKNTIVIPDDLLRRERNEVYVFIIKENQAFKRKIVPGRAQDGLLEVRSELEEGEILVRRGVDQVYDGAPILEEVSP
jgi:membrane fusion protein (multidrug efflux system)